MYVCTADDFSLRKLKLQYEDSQPGTSSSKPRSLFDALDHTEVTHIYILSMLCLTCSLYLAPVRVVLYDFRISLISRVSHRPAARRSPRSSLHKMYSRRK